MSTPPSSPTPSGQSSSHVTIVFSQGLLLHNTQSSVMRNQVVLPSSVQVPALATTYYLAPALTQGQNHWSTQSSHHSHPSTSSSFIPIPSSSSHSPSHSYLFSPTSHSISSIISFIPSCHHHSISSSFQPSSYTNFCS